MGKLSKEERREKFRKRQREAAESSKKGGGGGGRVLNYGSLGDFSFDDGFFKPRTGRRDKNLIDIIPFEVTAEWYPSLLTWQGKACGIQPGELDFKLEIPVHRRIGPDNKDFLCLRLAFGRPCPICEESKRIEGDRKMDEKAKETAVAAFKPSWRTALNVIDLTVAEKDQYVQVWEVSRFLFTKEMETAAQELGETEPLTPADLDEGWSIEFVGKEKQLGKYPFIEAEAFEFLERPPYEDDIVDDAYALDTLLVIPTYEDVLAGLHGMDAEEAAHMASGGKPSSVPEEDAPAPARGGRRAGGRPAPEPEKDEPAPAPRRRGSRAVSEPAEEDDIPFDKGSGGKDDEPEPAPAETRRRRRPR